MKKDYQRKDEHKKVSAYTKRDSEKPRKAPQKTCKNRFFGTVTVGEKGQIVIPASLRKKLSLQKGEKLLVVDGGNDSVGLVKVDRLEEHLKELRSYLHNI